MVVVQSSGLFQRVSFVLSGVLSCQVMIIWATFFLYEVFFILFQVTLSRHGNISVA